MMAAVTRIISPVPSPAERRIMITEGSAGLGDDRRRPGPGAREPHLEGHSHGHGPGPADEPEVLPDP